MSFPFLPRAVAKRNPANVSAAKVNTPLGSVPTTSQPNASSKGKEKAPGGPSAEECAFLVSLALSEYALWEDPDLRMKFDEDNGYISLHHLLHHRQVLAPLRKVPQTVLVKHLKTHLADTLDFRMMVAEPRPWFNRAGEASSQQPGGFGGYEMRLKAPSTSIAVLSKLDWEKRMVYVENVPIQYRNITALVKFLLALLPAHHELPVFSRIQNVYLPPHHQDKPGDLPTFKGFALVTFRREPDVQCVLKSWPWQPDPSEPKLDHASGSTEGEAASDARKFGFRATGKATWEALRTEYLVYRQQLVEEINAFQDSSASKFATIHTTTTASNEPPVTTRMEPSLKVQKRPKVSTGSSQNTLITLSSPYPYGCLLFIKNIHHETNKTTLKAFFGKALANASNGIDYVDFNKGMDTCYLRLSTPSSVQLLSDQFTSNAIVQTNGLDDTGSSILSSKQEDVKPIVVEVVSGRREEMYWQKVPEKISRGAVEKAVKLQHEAGAGDKEEDGGERQPGGDNRPKKRRKR